MIFSHVIAADTETALFGRGEDLAPPPACLTYCSNEDHEPGIAVSRDMQRVFRGIASNDNATLVGANWAYDAWVLIRQFPELTRDMFEMYDAGRIIDVQLNERLIDIAQGKLDGAYDPNTGKYVQKYYSLAALHDLYGHGVLDKSGDTWRLRYGELIGVPLETWPHDARKYAMDDAAATLRVYESQLQHHTWWRDDSAAQARAAFALRKVAIRGLITDGEAVESYIKELEQLVRDSGDKLKDAGIVRDNGSKDTKKAKARMLEVCAANDIEPKLTDTAKQKRLSVAAAIQGGYISLDAEACRAVSFDELLTAYGVYSTSDSILTRAEQLREGSKGLPLQSEFVSLLDNGRTSSRIPKLPIIGVQTQNLPRVGKLRECFIPRPGYYYLSIDFNSDEIIAFAQCELRLTGKSLLAEALRDGLDVHCVLAADILGEPYDVVVKNKKHSKYKEARQLAKIGNFGLLGGMGAATLCKQANAKAKKPEERITLRQAEMIRSAWYTRWQTQAYFDAVKGALGQDAWNNVCVVRQFVSGRVRGALSFTEACNTLFSGLAGDGNKDVLYQCVRAAALATPDSPFYDTHVVNFLHDELFFEVPVCTATESAKALCQLMVDTKRKWNPDVTSSCEPALMRRWYKAAEPVWSQDGELLPWEPPAAHEAKAA